LNKPEPKIRSNWQVNQWNVVFWEKGIFEMMKCQILKGAK
jgi:hypothetical protein